MPATFSFPRLAHGHVDGGAVHASECVVSLQRSPAWHGCKMARRVESARTEITALIEDLSRIVPNQRGLISTAIPLQESLVGRIARALWTLMAAVALVLLVACANVANLFLVRSETRQREVAIRRALGAGRRSVARYFFAESALLSLIGGALGFVLAWAGIQLLVAFGPASLPRLDEVRLDIVTVAFTIGLTIRRDSGVRRDPGPPSCAGRTDAARERSRPVADARQPSRATVPDGSAGGAGARPARRVRAHGPQLPEAARGRSGVQPGIDAHLQHRAASERIPDASRRPSMPMTNILERLSALPGVTAASATTCLPLAGACFGNGLRVDGRSAGPESATVVRLLPRRRRRLFRSDGHAAASRTQSRA